MIGVAPMIVTFNTLLGAYASLGMHTEALKVIGLIVKAGFELVTPRC
jgi:pentatricopeptide repeat protein